MKYVTGIHGLNISCTLETCGDWHQSGIQWKEPTIRESEGSILGNYGIELGKKIPEHENLYPVANHIRSLLDILIDGNFGYAQGMNEDFICVDKYDEEIFRKVLLLKVLPHWNDIDYFMCFEYREKWVEFKKINKIVPILPDKEKILDRYLTFMRKEEDEIDFFENLKKKYN